MAAIEAGDAFDYGRELARCVRPTTPEIDTTGRPSRK
jgi:hypothetical protein